MLWKCQFPDGKNRRDAVVPLHESKQRGKKIAKQVTKVSRVTCLASSIITGPLATQTNNDKPCPDPRHAEPSAQRGALMEKAMRIRGEGMGLLLRKKESTLFSQGNY